MIDRKLAELLPTPTETALLRACFHDAAGAADAWAQWLAAATRDGTTPRRALASQRSLVPLLAWNLRRHGIRPDSATATHLKAATLTEELRLGPYLAVCRTVLHQLAAAGVDVVVLKGAALGAVAYPSPVLRHADDIDLLVDGAEIERASRVLVDLGWSQEAPPIIPNPVHVPPLIHPSGVIVELHRFLLVPYYTIPLDAVRARARTGEIAGVASRALSPADALLHACAHGMLWGPMLRWVADAWFLVARNPDLDWDTFVATTRASRLALPVGVALDYLVTNMDLAVPQAVQHDIRSEGARTTWIGRAVARPWPQGPLSDAWRRPGPWWRRAARTWRRVFPPTVQFAYRCDVPIWQVPYHHLRRARRVLAGAAPTGAAARRRRTAAAHPSPRADTRDPGS